METLPWPCSSPRLHRPAFYGIFPLDKKTMVKGWLNHERNNK